ncbi:MAG: BamA/TamA family outer membrane protein [Chitinophagaceae bacterium]
MLWFSSCNYTKHLSQNQILLRENNVSVKSNTPIKYKGEMESILLSMVLPRANTHLFDLGVLPKYKLWKYNNKYSEYQKNPDHKKILKRKVEMPTLLDTVLIAQSVLRMNQYMINQGYFYNQVSHEITYNKDSSQASVHYTIETGKKYRINNLFFDIESKNLKQLVINEKEKSFLRKGNFFTKTDCGLEKDRIYKIVKNAGFYNFKADNVSFVVDTTNKESLKGLLIDPLLQAATYHDSLQSKNNDQLDVHIVIKKSKDVNYAIQYRINKVLVMIDKETWTTSVPLIENELEGLHFQYQYLPVNRKVLMRNIFIHPDEAYSIDNNNATIVRLNQLGMFKFVNIEYEYDSTETGRLIAKISLTTNKKMDMELRGDISTSDGDYFLGTGGSFTYRNKNLFSGANLFTLRSAISTEFRYDSLLRGETKDFYFSGYNLGISANMLMPKFIVPLNQSLFNKKNRPYTNIGFNYNLVSRRNLYTNINVSGSFGYIWTETNEKNWRFNPSFLTLTYVPDKFLSEAFKLKLENNEYLRRVFSNNIIYGENVAFEYKSKPRMKNNNSETVKIAFEEAGTLLKGINAIYKSISANEIDPIAHYLKGEVDARSYMQRRKSLWVNRGMIGVGIPLGNNAVLPYIKQYSAGGAFSNRGWRARTLGPGRSIDTSYKTTSTYIDRTGDLKFEMNSEYRFDLLKLFSGAINLKGAAFVDIGNIWLMNKNENIPGGEFQFNQFLNDLAISSGVGARLDFTYFVFRLDIGYPIKNPAVQKNAGFVVDQLRLKDGVFNFMIGYPF